MRLKIEPDQAALKLRKIHSRLGALVPVSQRLKTAKNKTLQLLYGSDSNDIGKSRKTTIDPKPIMCLFFKTSVEFQHGSQAEHGPLSDLSRSSSYFLLCCLSQGSAPGSLFQASPSLVQTQIHLSIRWGQTLKPCWTG